MRLGIIILIIILGCSDLYGQPGWAYKVQGNLNEIDSTSLKRCLRDGDLCYFGEIEIDSSTDLTRLSQINFLEKVTLIINLTSFPEEFKQVKFPNLKKLRIYSGKNLTQLDNLKYLTSVEELYIASYNGNEINLDFSMLPNLKFFSMYSAPKVERLDKVFEAPNLESVNLWTLPSLKFLTIDTISAHKNVIGLTLRDCPIFQIENVRYFQGLKYFSINGTNFTSIPEYLSEKLIVLSISNNKTLVDIKNISLYKKLKEYQLKDNPSIKDKHKKKRN